MRRAVSFLLHALVAMVISPIAAMVVLLGTVILFNNSPGINAALNAGGAANPWLWGPGLILGMLVNRFALKGTACWVWLVGMVWMVCGIFAALSSYHARFAGICSPLDSITNGFFFSVPKQPYCGDHGNLMRFTLPTLSATAYSLGAWITLWLVRHARPSPDPVKQQLVKNRHFAH
jgi:hypothetical protein